MKQSRTPERVFVAFVFAVFSYEWLVSGVDKLMSTTFVIGFQQELETAIAHMQYVSYGRWLEQVCVPHATTVAFLVEFGELFIGIGFLVLSLFVYRGTDARGTSVLGLLTGLLSAYMSVNFFLYQGGAFFVNTGDPFDEGIPIDLIMALIQFGMALYFARRLLKSTRHAHSERSPAQTVAQGFVHQE